MLRSKTISASVIIGLSVLADSIRATQISVSVGNPTYSPEYVTANVGDEIVFLFEKDNHTVSQSTYDSPCELVDGGFDTGFVVVPDGVTSDFPSATLTVQDSNPIWIFCRQTGACQSGMVFAVNPDTNYSAFQAAANASETSTTTSSVSTSSLEVVTSTLSVATATQTLSDSSGDVWTTTYGSYPGSAEPTAEASTNHVVVVGGDSLTYSPSNITAQPGDTITFQFKEENHTATQSSLSSPCEALEGGFNSGFYYVDANTTDFPEYTITVNDTAPIWVYCAQKGHCADGMVFSVNAVAPYDFTFFQEIANATKWETTSSSASTTATATATTYTTTSSASSSWGSGSGTCKRAYGAL